MAGPAASGNGAARNFLGFLKDYGPGLGALASGGALTYYMGSQRQRLQDSIDKERALRESSELRLQQLLEQERSTRKQLLEQEGSTRKQLLEQERSTRKQAIKDGVAARLFMIQNAQEYAGHPINQKPPPASS
jgi:hypothetical protein